MHVVYALQHPGERQTVLYIGLTTDLRTRYIRHLNNTSWIKPFLAKGLIPPCVTLQIIKDKDPEREFRRAKEREIHYIAFYAKMGMPLHNSHHNTPKPPKPPKPKKPPIDLGALRQQVRHLYVDEHVARADILRHPSVRHGTQLYWLVKNVCDLADQDEEDAQHE